MTENLMINMEQLRKFLNGKDHATKTELLYSISEEDGMILSIDAETDGLWGKPFAISAVLVNGRGIVVDKFNAVRKNLDDVVENEWVRENVLPVLDTSESEEYGLYEDMLRAFAEFYKKYKHIQVVWHMGQPVEAFLFRELHDHCLIEDFDAPYTPIELSTFMLARGISDVDSISKFIKRHWLNIDGQDHDPMFDCKSAALVYLCITNNVNTLIEM